MTNVIASRISVSEPVRNETFLRLVVLLVLVGSLGVVLATFRGHLITGGHSWNTADWLISSEVVHVRRGLFGSALLWVSDALRLSPIVMVAALQSGLALIVAAGAIRALFLAPSNALVAVLLVSPGFCLLFWAADPEGTARKELVTYAAMSVLLFTNGQPLRDRAIVLLASSIFAVGVSGHIANAMMTPMFLFMASIALGRAGRPWLVGAALMCLWAAFNTWYPIRFSAIASAGDVCRPLLERGLDEALCSDAIRVTAATTTAAVEFVADGAYAHGGFWHLLIYPELLVPIIYLVCRTNGWNFLKWPILLSVLPLLPLYLVGYDWGRQTVMHITPVILLVLLACLRGRIVQTRPIPRVVVWMLVVLGMAWAPRHTFGFEFGMPLAMLLRGLGIS